MIDAYRVYFEYDNNRKSVDFWIKNAPDVFAIKEAARSEIRKNGYSLDKCNNISD